MHDASLVTSNYIFTTTSYFYFFFFKMRNKQKMIQETTHFTTFNCLLMFQIKLFFIASS